MLDFRDFFLNVSEILFLGFPDVDDHVDFFGPFIHRERGFHGLHGRLVGPEREANDGANLHIASGELAGSQGNEDGIHADGCEMVFKGFVAKLQDLIGSRLRLEQRMIEITV